MNSKIFLETPPRVKKEELTEAEDSDSLLAVLNKHEAQVDVASLLTEKDIKKEPVDSKTSVKSPGSAEKKRRKRKPVIPSSDSSDEESTSASGQKNRSKLKPKSKISVKSKNSSKKSSPKKIDFSINVKKLKAPPTNVTRAIVSKVSFSQFSCFLINLKSGGHCIEL